MKEAEPKKQEKSQQESEQLHDQQVKSRTARYDQLLKERARKLAINPDNFDTEEVLEYAVTNKENENDR